MRLIHRYKVIFIAVLALTSTNLFAQASLSVSFSPAVGDTLDGFERQQLGLFPDVDGFLWAVFLVDEGKGNLKAKICSVYEDRLRLQLVNMDVTPNFLRRKIELTFEQDIQMSFQAEEPIVREPDRLRNKARRMPNPAVDSVVVLDAIVGSEIDRAERWRFSLFTSLKDFEGAVFFRTPDTLYYAMVRLSEKQGIARDTCIEFSAGSIRQIAQRIKASQDPDSVHVRKLAYQANRLRLPLSRKTTDLSRPYFHTPHLDISLGISFYDFSGIQTLIGESPHQGFPLSFLLDLPILEDPSISVIAGPGFALGGVGGGSLSFFTAVLVFETESVFFPFDPVIGVGVGRTMFSYTGGVIINVSSTYPVVLFGANLVRNRVRGVLTVPITRTLETTFESRSYSISPASTLLTVQFCL